MSIVQYRRSIRDIIRGIWIRLLARLAYFSFPYQVTVFLHKLRGVKVGKRAHIARYVFIDDRNPELVEIGEGVAITARVMILCHQRDLNNYKPGMMAMERPFIEKRVKIERGAHIGIGAIILPGVTIGQGAIIGAGAVVSQDIPPYSLAIGVPAKIVKRYINENLD